MFAVSGCMGEPVSQDGKARSNDLRQTSAVDAIARRWVQRAVGSGSTVAVSSPFRHGTSSEVTALDVVDRDGQHQALVLRRFVDAAWLDREPDLATREAAVLEALAATPVPAPVLVAVDPTGVDAGAPAVLTRRLPGKVVMRPPDLPAWLHDLADLMATIHRTPVPVGLRPYRPWYATVRALEPPAWSHDQAAWAAAIRRTRAPAPGGDTVLLHRDFNPTNVLWNRGRVSGIVDWVEASVGPPGADLGHCRSNLALGLSLEAADELRDVVAPAEYDPYWDLVSAVDFLADLPPPAPGPRARLDAFVAAAVGRL
jgi:aminoglycoside phosphotransferase (APT) family kinase protein